MINLFLFFFNFLLLLNGEKNFEECDMENARIYNPFFKNQKLFILAEDCNFIEYDNLSYIPKNKNCKNSSQILFLSEEVVEMDVKYKSTYILYKNDKSKSFEFRQVFEEKSDVYYVPGEPITPPTDISIIGKINCPIINIITNFLSLNYRLTKNAFFVRSTTDLFEDQKVFLNIYVMLKKWDQYNIIMFKLVIDINKSGLGKSKNIPHCTQKNAHMFYNLVSYKKIYKTFNTSKDMTQALYYNDYLISVKKLINHEKDENESQIELRFMDEGKRPTTLCLKKINHTRPIYISFYDEELFKVQDYDKGAKYKKIRNTIIYILVTVLLIIFIVLSCKYTNKKKKEKNTTDKEVKHKKVEKKKHKKLYEILNEKLQQQCFIYDDGKGPMMPYVKFDKRYNNKKNVPKKRVTGMEIKTLSKNIEYVST
uniref:6-cysteine protein n=2 Tax=Strongyloides stercoralis TaxID=6248 RepID=A0A0K0EJ61_STRER